MRMLSPRFALLFSLLLTVAAAASAASTADTVKPLRRLTSDRLQKIILLNEKNGSEMTISKAFAGAMDITKGDQVISGRMYTPDTHPNKFFFLQPTGTWNGYLFGAATVDGSFIFFLDKSLNLISAAQRLKGHDVVALSASDDRVKKNWDLLMDRWAEIADETPVAGIGKP